MITISPNLIGKRTIGVITKLDIMDPGTDAKDLLCNSVFRLKLGKGNGVFYVSLLFINHEPYIIRLTN